MATSLQKADNPRLDYILRKVKELDIRFPVADIAEKTRVSKGNISEMLKGKRAISDSVFKKFCDAYGLDGKYQVAKADDELNWERAAIKALTWKLADALSEISELKGSPRPVDEYLKEIDKSTTLILADLRSLGKLRVSSKKQGRSEEKD